MGRHEDLERVLDRRIVAIIRAASGEQLVQVAQALHGGGVDVIEVTLTVPGALDILAAVRKELGDRILLGAGTVLDPESARAAILAGAEFIVSPSLNLDVIELAHRYDKLVMPGALTPTEILTAWEAGADVVKVFPADIGGPAYMSALRGPFPHIRLLPTGGVNLATLGEFLKAGACCVGVGGSLVEKEAIRAGDFQRIRNLAEQYVTCLESVRAEMAAGTP